uniref:Protein-S-isoprenylcysteine O-methyltransferase n=1 Tax=Psilocybe cubensis TaxID=181762 RepID=A0A8H7XMM4_PSICU
MAFLLTNTRDLITPSINICILFATAVSVHLSLSPPNPSVKSDECCSGTEGTQTLFERFVQSITYCSKSMVWVGATINILYILLGCLASSSIGFPFDYAREGSFGKLSKPAFEGVHTATIIGGISAVVSAVLRMWCFRSLGPFFTFEITIRPKHELITHGPYAWVRHPSYTGVYMTLGGATLVLGAPGMWTADHGVWTPIGFVIACFWTFKCLYAFRGMCVRLRAEDQVLKDTFGGKWDDYATRVPRKFIPGVI